MTRPCPAYYDYLLTLVKGTPGFRAGDYCIWLFREYKVYRSTTTVRNALLQLEKRGLVKKTREPGGGGKLTPWNWEALP